MTHTHSDTLFKVHETRFLAFSEALSSGRILSHPLVARQTSVLGSQAVKWRRLSLPGHHDVMDCSILSVTHPPARMGQFGKNIVRGVGNSATPGDPPGHSATSVELLSILLHIFVLYLYL